VVQEGWRLFFTVKGWLAESKRIAWPPEAIVLPEALVAEVPAVVDEQDDLTGKKASRTEASTWFSIDISRHAQARTAARGRA
jgi:hypothetical protein